MIRPAPATPLRILIGGRSEAALRRTARLGDGWLALWVSARRFADAVAEIDELAENEGRRVEGWRHGLSLWCALPGADGRGAERLAATMEERYKMPFSRFERWCPVGPADEIADFVAAYVDAGCSDVTVTLPGGSPDEGIADAAEIRKQVLAQTAAQA
jgi:alkanesulfonate monooxygenase SsuD/methylene tetrahydromethanopterin reductase-like flavin-dependent oxidoreductase (luciferase family)